MKNMKKTILGVAIIAIVLMMMRGSVNAASVTANAEVKKGDTVTVTVNVDATAAVQFEMEYDNAKFEFLGASAGALGDNAGAAKDGVVKVAAFAVDGITTTQSVTLTFKALATTEGEDFTVSGLVTENTGKGETIANPTVVVKVSEGTTSGNNGEQQGTQVKPEENNGEQGTTSGDEEKTTKKEQNAKEKVGTDGKVIKKLPQTGTPVFMGVAAIIVVAGAVLIVKKAK